MVVVAGGGGVGFPANDIKSEKVPNGRSSWIRHKTAGIIKAKSGVIFASKSKIAILRRNFGYRAVSLSPSRSNSSRRERKSSNECITPFTPKYLNGKVSSAMTDNTVKKYTLPASWWVSEKIYELEKRALFSKVSHNAIPDPTICHQIDR
jgi:hypothetical protein